jgi:hypothetical protein
LAAYKVKEKTKGGTNMDWEDIDSLHQRAMVPGGWLVKAYEPACHNIEGQGIVSGWDFRIAMVFVPDSDHEWIIP